MRKNIKIKSIQLVFSAVLVVALVTFLVSGTQYSWSLRGGYCGDQTTAISRAEVEEIVDNFLKRLKGTEYISADQTYDTKKAFSEIEKFMAQLDREHAQLSGHENQAALRISVLQRVLDVIDEQHMMIDFADEFGEGVAWNFTMGRTPEGHLIAYGHRGHFVAINAENGIYTSGHQEGLFNDLLQDFKLGQIRRESVKVSVP